MVVLVIGFFCVLCVVVFLFKAKIGLLGGLFWCAGVVCV